MALLAFGPEGFKALLQFLRDKFPNSPMCWLVGLFQTPALRRRHTASTAGDQR